MARVFSIDPGQLDKTISIYRVDFAADQDGYGTEREVLLSTRKARFTRDSGIEKLKAGSDMKIEEVRFLIRTPKNFRVSRKDRIRYNGETYEVTYPNNYGDGSCYTEIWAELMTRRS